MMRNILHLSMLFLSLNAFAYPAKLLDYEDIPPLREAIQVRDLALDMFEKECIYNPSAKTAIADKTLTLPSTVFKYLSTISCAVYRDMVVDYTNDYTRMTSSANGFDPILALKFTYGSNVGHVKDQSFYLVALGADGKGIPIDDGGTVGNEIPKNGLLIYDYCVALENGYQTFHMWTLGSTAAVAGTQTNSRNLASALGYEFCLSSQ